MAYYSRSEMEEMKNGRKKALKQKPVKKKYIYSIPSLRITRIESNLTIDRLAKRYDIFQSEIFRIK